MSATTKRQLMFFLVFLCVAAGFTVTFQMAVVHGKSMMPTYKDGEVVLVNRLTKGPAQLHRGDVILVHSGKDLLIKRLVYMPGDMIATRYTPAFQPSARQYFEEIRQPGQTTNDNAVQLKVPPGYIVVLGDNLAVSDDSREFGPVAFSDVLGRVVSAPPPPYSL